MYFLLSFKSAPHPPIHALQYGMDFLLHFSFTMSIMLSFFSKRKEDFWFLLTAGSVSGVGGRAGGNVWPHSCTQNAESFKVLTAPAWPSTNPPEPSSHGQHLTLLPYLSMHSAMPSYSLHFLGSCFLLAQLCWPALAHANQHNSLPSSGLPLYFLEQNMKPTLPSLPSLGIFPQPRVPYKVFLYLIVTLLSSYLIKA